MLLLQPLLELVTNDRNRAEFRLERGVLSSLETKKEQEEHCKKRNAALDDLEVSAFLTMLIFGAARICPRNRHGKL